MRRYASVSLFLAVALLCLTAFPASANNVVPPLGKPPLFRANSNNHWFAYAPTSGPEIVGGFEATRTQSYEPTDLVTSNRGTGVGDSIDWVRPGSSSSPATRPVTPWG